MKTKLKDIIKIYEKDVDCEKCNCNDRECLDSLIEAFNDSNSENGAIILEG